MLTYPADEREHLHIVLVSQQGDTLEDIGNENHVLDGDDAVNVNLCVYKSHSDKILIRQLPDVNLCEE